MLVVYAKSYSCLQDESLAQDQFNPGPSPSGSQHSSYGSDSKEEENRKLLNTEENREEESLKEGPDDGNHISLYQRIKRKLSKTWIRFKNFVRNLAHPIILHPPFSEAEEPKFRDTCS
jgi:hypothetical protein